MNNPKIQKKISVIIATYNAHNYIRACLSSILKQTYKNFEILIIDNNSSDDTLKIVHSLKSKIITIIKNHENMGFAKANNIGIKEGIRNGSEYLLLLNQDTLVESNLLKKLSFYSDILKDAGAISPAILIKKNKRIWWIGTHIFPLRELFEESRASIGKHIRKEKENYNLKKPKEVEAITGCSMFIPKNTIEKIGLFDEKFFMYGEDIDYSLRMKKEGFRMYIIPNTTVYHDVSIENEQNTSNLKKSIMKIYNYTLSNYINIIKHFSLTYLAIWSIRLPIVAIYELIKRKTK